MGCSGSKPAKEAEETAVATAKADAEAFVARASAQAAEKEEAEKKAEAEVAAAEAAREEAEKEAAAVAAKVVAEKAAAEKAAAKAEGERTASPEAGSVRRVSYRDGGRIKRTTFLGDDGEAPTPVSDASPPPPAPTPDTDQRGIERVITLPEEGMLGFSLSNPKSTTSRLIINGVKEGSQADTYRVPVDSVLVAIGDQNVDGFSREQVYALPAMKLRPLKVTVCVPAPRRVSPAAANGTHSTPSPSSGRAARAARAAQSAVSGEDEVVPRKSALSWVEQAILDDLARVSEDGEEEEEEAEAEALESSPTAGVADSNHRRASFAM